MGTSLSTVISRISARSEPQSNISDMFSTIISNKSQSSRPSYHLEETDDLNGLQFNDILIPEEMLIYILSFLDAKDLLLYSTVCIKWNQIIKDNISQVWKLKYRREFNKQPKNLPWEVFYLLFSTNYFDTNLIKNPNGREGLKKWKVIRSGGDGWRVENPPAGAKSLPENTCELSTSCFATSYASCSKMQKISFTNSNLLCNILDKYQPAIFISEWVTGRFDCSSIYELNISLMKDDDNILATKSITKSFEGFTDPDWEKSELIFNNYGVGLRHIIYFHKGRDSQFWKGHYGSKIAGSVCMLNFDSIAVTKNM